MDAISIDSLPDLVRSFAWGLAALFVVSYFVGCYLFEILAQKQGEPRWMAWVPVANAYLMLRLLGWGTLFWWLLAGYAFALLGMFLPPPLSLLALLAMFPTALAVLVIAFVYWPLLARRRGLSLGVGLLLVLPQLALVPLEFVLSETVVFALSLAVSAVGFGAFLWIVFHDGGPEAAPHPVGLGLTGLVALVAVVLALELPAWMEESGALESMRAALAEEAGAPAAGDGGGASPGGGEVAALLARLRGLGSGATPDPGSEAAPVAFSPPGAPPPRSGADTCPADLREAGARPPAGREWWCELETPEGWVRHGPARRWIHSRAVGEEGAYHRGRRHGTWTRYWRTGGRHTQAEFRDGVQHGWMHRWDEAGRPLAPTRFEDGEVAPPGTRGS